MELTERQNLTQELKDNLLLISVRVTRDLLTEPGEDKFYTRASEKDLLASANMLPEYVLPKRQRTGQEDSEGRPPVKFD